MVAVDAPLRGRMINSGVDWRKLRVQDLVDLIYFWLVEGRDEADAMKTLSKFEVPPPGYAGSLAGTLWDPETMIDAYQRQAGSV